jgi:hypothetical protein
MAGVCIHYFVTYPHQQETSYAWCCSTASKNCYSVPVARFVRRVISLSFQKKKLFVRHHIGLKVQLGRGLAKTSIKEEDKTHSRGEKKHFYMRFRVLRNLI